MQTTFTRRIIIIVSLSMVSLFTPLSRVTAQTVNTLGTGIKDGTPTPIRHAAQLTQKTSGSTASGKSATLPLRWQVEEWDGNPHTLEFHFYYVQKDNNGKKVLVSADDNFELIPDKSIKDDASFIVTVTTKPGNKPSIDKGLYVLAGTYKADDDGPFDQKGAGFILLQVEPPQ